MTDNPQASPERFKSIELGPSSLVNRAKILGGRVIGRTVYMPTQVSPDSGIVDLITKNHYDSLPDGTELMQTDGSPVVKNPDLPIDTRATRFKRVGYEMTSVGFPHPDEAPTQGYIAPKRQG